MTVATHQEILLQGFLSKVQTSLLSHRNFECRKFDFYTFQRVNNETTDQTVQMRRLICAFVVCMQQNQIFSISHEVNI